jgi:hypothetical protein
MAEAGIAIGKLTAQVVVISNRSENKHLYLVSKIDIIIL